MNEQKLAEIVSIYKCHFDYLSKNEIYKWDSVKAFRESRLLDGFADDTEFYLRLKYITDIMDNLLNGGQYFPGKKALLKCAELDPVHVRKCLIDLNFSEFENIPLEERLDHFNSEMREIAVYSGLSEDEIKTFDGYRTVTLFLFYMYPAKYYIFKPQETTDVRKRIDFEMDKSKHPVLQAYDMYETIRAYIVKDKELMDLYRFREMSYPGCDPEYHLLVQDIIWSTRYNFDKKEKIEKLEVDYSVNRSPSLNPAPIRTNTVIKDKNYEEETRRNKSIGDSGERFVMKYELERLTKLFPDDESKRPEHVSVTKGDGLGYDIKSFDEKGRVIYIEVKTTTGRFDEGFYFSDNELLFSEGNPDQYHLYRVYKFKNGIGCITDIPGSLKRFAKYPKNYWISLKTN